MYINTIKSYIKIVEYLLENKATSRKIETMLNSNGLNPDIKSIQNYLKFNINDFYGAEIIIREKGRIYTVDLEKYKKIEDNFSLSKNTFIVYYLLRLNPNLQKHLSYDMFNSAGTKYIENIINAIKGKKTLKIKYIDFNNKDKYVEEEELEIEPYLLKTYLNRFFIIGKERTNNKIRPFALYKINKLQLSSEGFTMPNIKAIKEKYSKIIGVTHYYDNPPNPPKVVIEFIDYQFKYFETEPWVKEYKVEERSENDKTVIVSFYVHPNNELHQRILFNNVKCRVLEPKSLVTRIKDILSETLELYKN